MRFALRGFMMRYAAGRATFVLIKGPQIKFAIQSMKLVHGVFSTILSKVICPG